MKMLLKTNKEKPMDVLVHTVKEWVKARWAERTSWDGAALIAVGVLALVAHPLMHLAAWGAILWGAWTLWKEEK